MIENKESLKAELKNYYFKILPDDLERYVFACKKKYETENKDNQSAYEKKAMGYEIISENCPLHLFENLPFYFELGSLPARSDGADYSCIYPGSWCFKDNNRILKQSIPEDIKDKDSLCRELNFYTFCGPTGDQRQHYSFNISTILEIGLKGVAQNIESALKISQDAVEKAFFKNMLIGIFAIKKISERFADLAEKKYNSAKTKQQKEHFRRILQSAEFTPWNPPRNFYEALNLFAFFQTVVSSMEGIGIETMGRIDYLLDRFYRSDIENGVLTQEEAYDLIEKFCLMWHSRVYESDSDYGSYDPAFTYTLGGCDSEGKPFCNDVTLMFLRANRENKLIHPKIKCRFSKESPKRYLDEINTDILEGRTNSMYQNDDTTIPALIKNGIESDDALNYSVLGCWEPVVPNAADEHCSYFNLLKIMEYSVYGDSVAKRIGITCIEDAKSFDELYDIFLRNIKKVMNIRCSVAFFGRQELHLCNPLLLLSSVNSSCVAKRRDYTNGGMKYYTDEIILTGFSNTIDSLLAIKSICFDKKLITLKEYIMALKSNWVGFEDIHIQALNSSFFGDENEESSNLAKDFNHKLYQFALEQPVLFGGKAGIGQMLYSEMYQWCKKIRATPDGRNDGDWFARGYNISHLHPTSVTAQLNAVSSIDTVENAGNSVINIILDFKSQELDKAESLIRAAAALGVQSLQLNCVSKEELADATVNPEKHRDLVVRVCGYSARFIGLGREVQNELIARSR